MGKKSPSTIATDCESQLESANLFAISYGMTVLMLMCHCCPTFQLDLPPKNFIWGPRIGIQKNGAFGRPCLCPCQEEGFWRKRWKWQICVLTSKTRDLLLRPHENDETDKHGGCHAGEGMVYQRYGFLFPDQKPSPRKSWNILREKKSQGFQKECQRGAWFRDPINA